LAGDVLGGHVLINKPQTVPFSVCQEHHARFALTLRNGLSFHTVRVRRHATKVKRNGTSAAGIFDQETRQHCRDPCDFINPILFIALLI
jgi:hypothetical protein